jgi:glycosyltransferase involved in cell wall biosynthesis
MKPGRIAFHHPGARMNYALPLALHQQNLLECVATDFYAYSWMTEGVKTVEKLIDTPISITGKLHTKRQNTLPDSKILSLNWIYLLFKLFNKKDSYYDQYLLNQKLSLSIASLFKEKRQETSHIYCFTWNAANCRAIMDSTPIITDQIQSVIKPFIPMFEREQQTFCDWICAKSMATEIKELWQKLERQDKQSTDYFFAPSNSIQESLINDLGIDEEKVFLNPYPAPFWLYDYNTCFKENSTRIMRSSASEDKLKILFVGSVDIRKGIPYLLQALRKLNPHKFTAKVVGSIGINENKVKEYSDIVTFTGKLNKPELTKCYEWADVFVFPSLSEGSAGVIYEAMAFGLPVITTKSSGSHVNNGIEGFIIEERNVDQIVESLMLYLENPSLVNLHGQNSWEKIKDFDIEQTGIRLKKLLTLIS